MSYKKMICIALTTALSPFFFVTTVSAETLYVSDVQFVAIRAEATNSSPVVERSLRSGTPLEVVEKVDGYTRVMTPKGNEGWIANYYLANDAVSRDIISKQETEIAKLLENRITLDQEISTLKSQLTDAKKSLNELTERNRYLDGLTKETQSILAKNDSSEFEIQSLRQRLEIAETTNKINSEENERQWFLVGAATLLVGLLAGFTLPFIKRNKSKKSTW